MSVNKAIEHILENNLDKMREELSSSLTAKAIAMLEEKKQEIGKNYFGQK
jgi:hypothetical protein